MGLRKLRAEKSLFRHHAILGGVVGGSYACVEFYLRRGTEDTVPFLPLVIKAIIVGSLIALSIVAFRLLTEERLAKKPFLYLSMIKTLFYTTSITFWLIVANGMWYALNGGIPLKEEMTAYLTDEKYLINLLTVAIIVMAAVSLAQVNSLHRKGELMNFIFGRYNSPKEVERIFCFVDLKGSTSIAEKLGHRRFANFLKDYYSDITEALRQTKARIYQYAGDEVILSWNYETGYADNNFIRCFFSMKATFDRLRPKYEVEYGVFPEFRAGAHSGKVIVTWIGELKREIVYVGDVMNTTSRIQEQCKVLATDFLVSEDVLRGARLHPDFEAHFMKEITPRGKEAHIKLYSLNTLEAVNKQDLAKTEKVLVSN